MASLKRKKSVDDDAIGYLAGKRRAKLAKGDNLQRADAVRRGLLAQYYHTVQTLRDYMLSKLPRSSRKRRKKVASVGQGEPSSDRAPCEEEAALGRLLDSTLVCLIQDSNRQDDEAKSDNRWEQWMSFSRRDESAANHSHGLADALFCQSEIVHFAIWCMFGREKGGVRPNHLLCDGYQRQDPGRQHVRMGKGEKDKCGEMQALSARFPNDRVRALKEKPWPQLLVLLGREGESIMIDLLLDCAIFVKLEAGRGNYYQLSGVAVADEERLAEKAAKLQGTPPKAGHLPSPLRPSEITFVRSRMMYARPALNARASVHFGLRHIHVLNRYPYHSPSSIPETGQDSGKQAAMMQQNKRHTMHVMMYIFPRQFGLHNVFCSLVNRRQTAQKFQDYTLREEEISHKYAKAGRDEPTDLPVPKRLRGKAQELVQKLQLLHQRCSYASLLQFYCPLPEQMEAGRRAATSSSKASSQSSGSGRKWQQSAARLPALQYSSIVDLATPVGHVSAYCQAVLSRLIPDDFWGNRDARECRECNRANFLKKVDRFVRLRRFESMSLHEVMQEMKISEIDWLAPPTLATKKCSRTDTQKRTEIFLEFLYYLFDSLLIPLIRSSFYVTESNMHRYRLFYFRHDVWRCVAEPAMASLKTNMLEEVRVQDALRILDARSLAVSQVRLLPKQSTMRPIMNLRRRSPQANKSLGQSINQMLDPISSVLKLERALNPARLGSALFSVGEIYARLKAFKSACGSGRPRFFFAKVDVQAAFDTIPQDTVVHLMRTILQQSRYKMLRYGEVQLASTSVRSSAHSKVLRKWHTRATPTHDSTDFQTLLEQRLAENRTDTIFLDGRFPRYVDTQQLLALLETHVRENLVKIGKKYYRQKNGIPQGSVLSSSLCNYFYADLEMRHLSFLTSPDCLLLRLIDDFLLVTTSKPKAERFVQVMHQGLPDYGLKVGPSKSLVNFEHVTKEGDMIPRINDDARFPFCGTLIDASSLDVAKLRDVKDPVVSNGLTVEFSRCPGQNFQRKTINAFRILSHPIFFDTAHNSSQTVLANLYDAFVETATKTWAYARCLPKTRRPGLHALIDTVRTLIDVAFLLLASRRRRRRFPGYVCTVKKAQVAWLAMTAFRQVMVKKQAGYRDMIVWLEGQIQKMPAEKIARIGQVASSLS